MFSWLKDKTLGRLQCWLSEKVARAYQDLHTQRLHKMAKNLPEEFVEINQKLEILNSNSWAVHHLYKKAMGNKKYPEAFLYFFYGFELNLKHLIMSEMVMKNFSKSIKDKKPDIFSVCPSAQIRGIQKEGRVAKLIQKFCDLHGSQISEELRRINSERNFIIHNMMKRKLTEREVKEAFENFFTRNRGAIVEVYKRFDTILTERPSNKKECPGCGSKNIVDTGAMMGDAVAVLPGREIPEPRQPLCECKYRGNDFLLNK